MIQDFEYYYNLWKFASDWKYVKISIKIIINYIYDNKKKKELWLSKPLVFHT